MRLSVRNSGRYSYIVFASETEAEAVEYIMNRLESEVIQDDI